MNSLANIQDPLKYTKLGKYDISELKSKQIYTGELKTSIKNLRDRFIEEFKQNNELYHRSDYELIIDVNNDWHCYRYLKHYKMNIDLAFEGMKKTLKWRKEVKLHEETRECFPKEFWLYGIYFICGASKEGNPILYGLTNRYRDPKQIDIRNLMKRFVCFMFESLDSNYPLDIQVNIVMDETNGSVYNVDIEMLRWLVSIRDYWPSRVKSLYVIGLPFLIQPVVRLILSWMPKEWNELFKIGNVDIVLGMVDNEELAWHYGGSKDATCRLAPPGSKWAKDMELFQDDENMAKLYRSLADHLPAEERESLRELQIVYDRLLSEQQ